MLSAIKNKRTNEFSKAALISAVLLLILLARTEKLLSTNPLFPLAWDHHKYIEMALNPFSFHIAPYCWRIFVPTLSFLAPFDIQTNFLIITLLSIFFTSILLFLILKEYNFEEKYALLGPVIYFGLGWATKYFLFDFWLVDPAAILFILSVIYAIIKKNDTAFVILLIVGILVKETVFFAAPLYYSLNAKKILEPRLFLRFLELIAPAVLIFLLLRIFIPSYNGNQEYLASLPLKLKIVHDNQSSYNLGIYFNTSHSFLAVLKNIVGTFGLLLMVFPIFNIKENIGILIRYSPFLVIGFLQVLSPVNVPRLLIICFPVFIIMTLKSVKKLTEEKRIPINSFYLVTVLLYFFNLADPYIPNLRIKYQAAILLFYFIILFIIGNKGRHENSLFRKI